MEPRITDRRKARLLFVSKGEDSASTRYRALQFFNLWKTYGFEPFHVTASGGLRATLNMLRQASQADVVIVVRKTFPSLLLRLLRLMSRKLVFDFDDAIFCNTDGTPSPTRMGRFAAMARLCDHIFAGNGFLAVKAAEFNPKVTVIPTSIDFDRYGIVAQKPDDFIDLVWIGSSSTRKYLVEALPWVESAAERIPGLRLKIIADFDLPDCRIPTVPIRWNAGTEAFELASSHIGIAPMRDDDWSRGKCALKVLQYMAAGLPVVSSNAGVNAEVVADGETGFLASSLEDWVKSIAVLASDPELRRRIGKAGRKRVETNYSATAIFERMLSETTGIMRQP